MAVDPLIFQEIGVDFARFPGGIFLSNGSLGVRCSCPTIHAHIPEATLPSMDTGVLEKMKDTP